jgi:hypothetical protein
MHSPDDVALLLQMKVFLSSNKLLASVISVSFVFSDEVLGVH